MGAREESDSAAEPEVEATVVADIEEGADDAANSAVTIAGCDNARLAT